jgi:YihY family inner membrane protein
MAGSATVTLKSVSKTALRVLLEAGRLWQSHNALGSAGALAFYTLFSLAPILIFMIAGVGVVLGPEAAQTRIVGQLQALIGPEAAQAARAMVAQASIARGGWLPTVGGIAAMMAGATAVFAQLQRSLNAIWEVPAQATRGRRLWVLVRNRLVSLVIVALFGLSFVVSLLSSVALKAIARFAADWLPFDVGLLAPLEATVTVVLMALLFAAMFRFLPDARLAWRDVLPGALITAILFMPGRQLMATYLALTAPGSAYGAAGSLVVLLLWIYGSALILLFGATLTRALQLQLRVRTGMRASGSRIATHPPTR